MNEYNGTKQRGRICAFNMLMCAVMIGFAGTLGAGTVTRASLQGAIDAAAARGGGKVTVPAGGHFMEGPLHLRSNVELALADGAELVFTDDPKAYLPTYDERLTDIHDIAIHNVTCERTPYLVRLAGDAACPLREITIEGVTAQKVTKTPVVLANCTWVSVNGKDADAETTLAARLKARGESLEAIRAAELAFVLGEAKRRFGKPATVLAGSATYAAAERAAREHPEFVGRLIRAQGEKTVLPQ